MEKQHGIIVKHNRTILYDLKFNSQCELRVAAMALIKHKETCDYKDFPHHWDDEICKKMAAKPYIQRLAIAGAFCAAEIDRIWAGNYY